MQQHCLNNTELSRFIDITIENGKLYEEDHILALLLDSWRSWDLEIVCLATLLSYILERRQKQSLDALSLLKRIYNLPEETGLGFVLEQIDDRFVDYMLRSTRRKELSIDDDLIDIRHQFGEYNYKSLR